MDSFSLLSRFVLASVKRDLLRDSGLTSRFRNVAFRHSSRPCILGVSSSLLLKVEQTTRLNGSNFSGKNIDIV